jgi:hypothetical protein
MMTSATQLGAVEAGRQLRNPALWLSMVPAVLWTIAVDNPTDEHFLLTGFGLVLAWFTAMAITAFGARRVSQRLIRDALDVLPGGSDVRTLGVGLGAVGSAIAGLVVTIVVWVARTPGPVLGTANDTIPRGLEIPRPSLAQLMQGPLVLLVFASIGLLLGRWVPGWLLVPALFLPIMFQFLWFGVWNAPGTSWYVWLLPMANGWVSNEWIGDCTPTSSCDLRLSGFDGVTPWWHAAYLVSLAATFVSSAVAIDGRVSARRCALMCGTLTVVLGVVQVATYERWTP